MGAKTKPWLTHICIKKNVTDLRELWCGNVQTDVQNCSHYPTLFRLWGPSGCWCHCTAAGSRRCRNQSVRWCSWSQLETQQLPWKSEKYKVRQWQINSLLEISVNVRGKLKDQSHLHHSFCTFSSKKMQALYCMLDKVGQYIQSKQILYKLHIQIWTKTDWKRDSNRYISVTKWGWG